VGVQGRGAGSRKLLLREELSDLRVFLSPVLGGHLGKDLGHPAPTDIFDENRLFGGSGGPVPLLDPSQRFNRSDILPELLLHPADTDFIDLGDPVITDAKL